MEEQWLTFAQKIQAIAQTGLTYGEGIYDRERYEELHQLSMRMLAMLGDLPLAQIERLFPVEVGYHTPKVDVRGVVVQEEKILLVREKSDGCWALPGGWADVGYSPGEIAVKEVREEAGLEVRAERLLGVLDKKHHAHPQHLYYTYKIFIACEVLGGSIQGGVETSEVDFFSPDELPVLSTGRNTESQILAMYARAITPNMPALFD